MGKKAVEMGRYGASKLMRNKKTSKESCELRHQQTYSIHPRFCWISHGSTINKSKTKKEI